MPPDDDADLQAYEVHETFLGGMLGPLVSRHETFLDALAVAKQRADKNRAIVHQQQIIWPLPGRS